MKRNDFQNKYSLARDESIFLAKKTLVASIYSGARVEGLNVTFPETQAIVDGANVARLSVSDVLAIRNLKNAWRFAIEHIGAPFDLNFVCRVNRDVSNNESLAWGSLRTGHIGIGGTDWKPPVPDGQKTQKDIERILQAPTATERALDFYLYGCRNQLFWDGNKRTSMICANKIMIESGAGLLCVSDRHLAEFNQRLQDFYNTSDGAPLKRFLYDACIIGMEKTRSPSLKAVKQSLNDIGVAETSAQTSADYLLPLVQKNIDAAMLARTIPAHSPKIQKGKFIGKKPTDYKGK
jgi:hypothetical protein